MNIEKIVSILLVTILFIRCAQIGTIDGGPKDINPPKVIKSTPLNYSTHFKEKRIRIDFDEYINLKNIDQEFNVSPPLQKKPKIWIKDKSILIHITDTLFSNTTYTFSFGNSIVDNNEGNILEDFKFVVSTGSELDSLAILGKVIDALTLNPTTNPLLIALYANLSDSAPMKEKPLYTARSKKDGTYTLSHLKSGLYKLYAFSDQNSNYRYDPFVESIAFYDSIIHLTSDQILQKPVSFEWDTLHDCQMHAHVEIDSTKLKPIQNNLYIDLKSFFEINTVAEVKNYYRPDRPLCIISMTYPIHTDSIRLSLVYSETENWYKIEPTHTFSDSILIWITDSMAITSDTLRIAFSYNFESLKNNYHKSDTILFRYFSDKKIAQGGKEKKLKVTSKIDNPHEINNPIILETEYPIKKLNKENIQLNKQKDTTFINIPLEMEYDNFSERKIYIKNFWESEGNYQLIILPNTFVSIYETTNDTLQLKFRIRRAEYYGSLHIQPVNFFYPCIVQLLEKDNVIYEQYFEKEQQMTFNYLTPKEYRLRIIWDTDKNKKFTTGSLLMKIQPEKVVYYKEPIKIRSNWDIEINWNR